MGPLYTDPLIVDTPEEGLDNEGVYTELVPLFRRAKETRQIFVVTHYANLPVNGDAEHIVALEASSYMDKEDFGAVFLDNTFNLTAVQQAAIHEMLSMPEWSSKIRAFLTQTLKLSDNDTDATIIRILDRLKTQSRIKKIACVEGEYPAEAIGGLDRPAVMLAVQNIMEGSEAAFRKRSEKYGF